MNKILCILRSITTEHFTWGWGWITGVCCGDWSSSCWPFGIYYVVPLGQVEQHLPCCLIRTYAPQQFADFWNGYLSRLYSRLTFFPSSCTTVLCIPKSLGCAAGHYCLPKINRLERFYILKFWWKEFILHQIPNFSCTWQLMWNCSYQISVSA